MSQEESVKVRTLWGDSEGAWRIPDRTHWTQHPKVQERLNALVSGNHRMDRFQSFLHKHLNRRLPLKRALTLGCGHGELERGLSQYNVAVVHEGVDIADGAIREATRLADESGLSHLRYKVCDVNS